eukprot:403345342
MINEIDSDDWDVLQKMKQYRKQNNQNVTDMNKQQHIDIRNSLDQHGRKNNNQDKKQIVNDEVLNIHNQDDQQSEQPIEPKMPYQSNIFVNRDYEIKDNSSSSRQKQDLSQKSNWDSIDSKNIGESGKNRVFKQAAKQAVLISALKGKKFKAQSDDNIQENFPKSPNTRDNKNEIKYQDDQNYSQKQFKKKNTKNNEQTPTKSTNSISPDKAFDSLRRLNYSTTFPQESLALNQTPNSTFQKSIDDSQSDLFDKSSKSRSRQKNQANLSKNKELGEESNQNLTCWQKTLKFYEIAKSFTIKSVNCFQAITNKFKHGNDNIWIKSILNSRQSFKNYKEMTPVEKKEKRLYLWSQSEVRVEPIDENGLVDEDGNFISVNNYWKNQQEKTAWYMIDTTQSMGQAWSVIMYIFTIYTLFATPYVGYFIFDFLSVIPSLIANESKALYLFKLARFVHAERLFALFKFILVKFLLSRGYNRMKVADYANLLTLMIFVIFSTHILACIYIYIGRRERYLPEDQRKGWIYSDPSFIDPEAFRQIYIFALYFILQTITTVGYGDHTGNLRDEFIFCMSLEFIGLSLFSFMMGSINNMINKNDSFESLLDEKVSSLDIWIKKVEKSNKPNYIPPDLYSSIKRYVQDAFLHDFNLIIEEFPFYHQVSPKMQTELINILFKDFQQQFRGFFQHCERGFLNELIINMYCRIYEPDQTVIQYGHKVHELYFIREGQVSLYNRYLNKDFILLPQYSVFGDYQIFYDLKSNINFKTKSKGENVRFMCVAKKVFLNLCDLFPITAENLRVQGLRRRAFFTKAMEQLDSKSSKNLQALKRSIKKKIRNMAESNVTSSATSPVGSKKIPDFSEYEDEEELEQFYSDEEPKIDIEDEETPEVVIKKISKKSSKYISSIHECTRQMDYNFDLLKRYLQEGRSENPEAVKLRGQVSILSSMFLKNTNVKTKFNSPSMSLQISERFQNTVNQQLKQSETQKDINGNEAQQDQPQTIPKIELFHKS